MATLSRKAGKRYSVTDWETNNKLLIDTAEHRLDLSLKTRQEGRALRHETACKTIWEESASRERLGERIDEVTQRRETLQYCIQEVEREIESLNEVKEEAERGLAATAVPLEVVVECLTQRECRREDELVNDLVEVELKKEAELIDATQQELQRLISEAFEQLCRLKEACQRLTSDLNNKMEALDVDLHCLSLTQRSSEISLKPDPSRMPIGSSTHHEWEQFTQYNVTKAEVQIQASLQLRETMTSTRTQSQTDLKTQRITTEFCMRKRAHQLQQACHQLGWEHKATREEISHLERDIHRLEQELDATDSPRKLVHTRLENRTTRPGVDLCIDQVQSGLVDEAKQLEATISVLGQHLVQSMHTLQSLEDHLARMGEDLSRKREALELEQRNIQIRQRLGTLPETQAIPGVTGGTSPNTARDQPAGMY